MVVQLDTLIQPGPSTSPRPDARLSRRRVPDRDLLWLMAVHPAPHGDLQQAVLETRADSARVYVFRQLQPPPEVAVIALARVVLGCLRLALAFPVDGQRSA